MKIYLIRHTMVALQEPTCYGQTDLDVANTFEKEAAETKRRLDGLKFDAVFSSPFRRATKLAAFCGYPNAQRDDRLKEMSMGKLEMVPFSQIADEKVQEWYDHFLDIQMPGGESTRQVMARMKDFFDELQQAPYERVAVFYHGCAILCTRILYGKLPLTAGFDDVTPFGGVEVLEL